MEIQRVPSMRTDDPTLGNGKLHLRAATVGCAGVRCHLLKRIGELKSTDWNTCPGGLGLPIPEVDVLL